MANNKIALLKSDFDSCSHKTDEGVEFWLARELQPLLGYKTWENFEIAVKRAITSCESADVVVLDHFREVTKMVEIGSGAKRELVNYQLTRYACYLIAQNGDPRKEEIAFAQSYFALQTRKQELIEERMQYFRRSEAREKLKASEKQLSQNIFERGVDDSGFGRIRSKGDKALFGGNTTSTKSRKTACKRSGQVG